MVNKIFCILFVSNFLTSLTRSACLNVVKNWAEIQKCCPIDDFLQYHNSSIHDGCVQQHKFQFSEKKLEFKVCVKSCYYRALGVIDENTVDADMIKTLNANRSEYEMEAIWEAAKICYYDEGDELQNQVMRHRTECNSYAYLYEACTNQIIKMQCHEKLWKKSPICDKFRAKDYC